MWRRIRHILIKEFIQALRDPRIRIFLFLPPLMQLMIYGYAINFDIKHIPVAVFNEDRTSVSRELINRFASTEFFDLNYSLTSPAQARDLLDRGKVTMVLRLPYDFAKQLKMGKAAPVQLLIDGTDSNAALVVGRYAGMVLNDYTQEILKERLGKKGLVGELSAPVALQTTTWFNPNRISRFSFVPGVIAMVVMLVSIMLTALAVVREKEIGTLEQLLVSPIRPVELMLGKTIPFILISLADVALVTLVGILWFEVPFRGNVLVLLLGTILFLFSSVGLGLLISTVCTTQQQAMMVSTFIFSPVILLSGLVFPIPNMPPLIQYITYINPLRYFIIVVQDTFLKGVGLAVLWPHIAASAALGVVMLSLSVLRFRRHIA